MTTYKKDKYRVEDALVPFLLEGMLICHGEQYPRHSKIVGRYIKWVSADYTEEIAHNKSAYRRLVNLYKHIIDNGYFVKGDIVKAYLTVTQLATFLQQEEQVILRKNTKHALTRINRILRLACKYREGTENQDKSAAKQAGKMFQLIQARGYF